MSPLVWIVLATLTGGLLSVLLAATVSFTLLSGFVKHLVSFSVGAMLAAALLNLLPEALESGMHPHQAGATLLAGLVVFFILEKLALWRHAHADGDDHHGHGHVHAHDNGHNHAHSHRHAVSEAAVHASAADSTGDAHSNDAAPPRRNVKPAALMVLVGDGVHNFADGVLLAAAFLQDIGLGIATTLAVVAHEVPQEVGDFMVLLDSGLSRTRALWLNVASSLTAVVGGVLGFFVLSSTQALVPYVLIFAAASFIYVAVADIVPELHRLHKPSVAPLQLALITAGVALVAATSSHFGHAH